MLCLSCCVSLCACIACAPAVVVNGGPGPSDSVSTLRILSDPQHTVSVLLRRKPGGVFWEKIFFKGRKHFGLHTPATKSSLHFILRDFLKKRYPFTIPL